MLYLTIKSLTLFFKLLFPQISLLLYIFKILLSFISSTIGFTSKFYRFLNILFFTLQLFLQFSVYVFHCIFLLSKLINFLAEFIIVWWHFIKFLICSH